MTTFTTLIVSMRDSRALDPEIHRVKPDEFRALHLLAHFALQIGLNIG
jgi:hypothetical protein